MKAKNTLIDARLVLIQSKWQSPGLMTFVLTVVVLGVTGCIHPL